MVSWTKSWGEPPQEEELTNKADRTAVHSGDALTARSWPQKCSNGPKAPAKTHCIAHPARRLTVFKPAQKSLAADLNPTKRQHCFQVLAFEPIHLHLTCKEPDQCLILNWIRYFVRIFFFFSIKKLKRSEIQATQIGFVVTSLRWDLVKVFTDTWEQEAKPTQKS